MIGAGRLRHRVTLEEPGTSVGLDGGLLNTWTPVATVFAEVLDLRGREFIAAREAHAELSVKVRIRYRPNVRPTMRVRFGARVLDVVHVVDVGGIFRLLELMCSEEVS
jgi:SPP1 family predicted phage head-tail adaptor